MSLLAILWLALLGVVPAAPSAVRVVAAVAAVVARSERHSEPEAVRAPAAARLAAARPAGQLTPVAPQRHAPPLALAAGQCDDAGAAARRALARQLSHDVVARGGLLPYFPTAPPLQG